MACVWLLVYIYFLVMILNIYIQSRAFVYGFLLNNRQNYVLKYENNDRALYTETTLKSDASYLIVIVVKRVVNN
jgi:hypothetical protein